MKKNKNRKKGSESELKFHEVPVNPTNLGASSAPSDAIWRNFALLHKMQSDAQEGEEKNMFWPSANLKFIFGMKLRNYRQERGYSLKQLAEKTGLSVSYINEIEKGKKYPKAEKILLLAKGLEIPYDDLVSLHMNQGMGSMMEVLNSSVLSAFPFQLFGISMENIMELFSHSPKKTTALFNTLVEIARTYDVDMESFFLASLRSYQEMHDNYFEDLESEVDKFIEDHHLEGFPPLNNEKIEALLKELKVDVITTDFADYPELREQREVYLPGKPAQLLLNSRLVPEQRTFLTALQLGYRVLKLSDEQRTTPWLKIESFDQLMNHFKASYFAGALLISRYQLEEDLRQFFRQPTWNPQGLLDLHARYEATPEMMLHRMSQVLPGLFGIKELHFLRFDHEQPLNHFRLTKELNLPRVLVPSGSGVDEHVCRRWLPITLLKEFERSRTKLQPPEVIVSAQRARFLNQKEVLFFSLARSLRLTPGMNRSISLGLHVDDSVRDLVRFLEDDRIPVMTVNETCERCPLSEAECSDRDAPPIVFRKERMLELRSRELERLHKDLH